MRSGGRAACLLLVTLAAASCAERRSGAQPAPVGGGGAPLRDKQVTVHLDRIAPGGSVVSFGVPFAPRALASPDTVRVEVEGASVPATIRTTLRDFDAAGTAIGVRAILVQLPSSALAGASDVTVRWDAPAQPLAPRDPVSYRADDVTFDSPQTVATTVRTIAPSGDGAVLNDGPVTRKVLFTSREPRVLATYPAGFVARSRILGRQVTSNEAAFGKLSGLRYLSDDLVAFTGAALYDGPTPITDDPDAVPDPKTSFEGWLYDRCATFLIAYAHAGEARFLRGALRTCASYAGQIELAGASRGIFRGKPDPDPKYSHARGLFAYYALTGDETAREAVRAIADLWLNDPLFVGPYRAGHVRGRDKLWTERLLGTSLEGLLYGYLVTGETKYLKAFRELFDTAYRHVTGDAAALAQINPGFHFPPQNCFVHSAEQQAEGDAKDPWCSGWMIDLVVDPLLRYQELTGDARVDEVFVRLTRFLRDVGTTYFHKDPLKDHFLTPSYCDDPNDTEDRRQLVPSYGSGIGADGVARTFGEYDDFLHCPDATAITAAGLRALRRQGKFDQNPIGPFASEGASFLQLHHELSFCAERALHDQHRPRRDPSRWSSHDLLPGLKDPAKFIRDNKIGWPVFALTPQRRLSWWFNTSAEEFSLLGDAGVEIRQITPGAIRGPSCVK